MSIFDVFKTKWSAENMTADDRKKLFWYLRRKTSYAAWKRVADAFDEFAAIFEQQVREEPIAKPKGAIFEYCWESYFPEVIKGQVFYEKGLRALSAGDRTVWLYNERGILDDAETIAGRWFIELVNHGMQGDHYMEGKYVLALTDSMRRYSKAAHDTAQIIQPRMADTPAPYAWSTFWKDNFALLPIPATLPEPPIPESDILVRTGEIAPAFGIYEPQIKDGCMNYLLAGVPAPTIPENDGTYSTGRKLSVTWRLLWEDTRYIDGVIPREEELYFPPERPIEVAKSATVAPELLSAATNEICPRAGEWAVMDDLEEKSALIQGQKLPSHKGREVIWVWLHK
jgi:hypothetical protein